MKYLNSKQPDIQEMQMAILISIVAQGLGSKTATVDSFIISGKDHTSTVQQKATAFDSFAAVARPFKGTKKDSV
ncbi:MAG: hypothetical protein DRG30_06135 [Epsilonproteobacteria bacterium]|nr:MAG: hypothetical protein DRG30_06135 [Campylobacterota bacterium]